MKKDGLYVSMILVVAGALTISVYYNLTSPFAPNTIVGAVDHRKSGQSQDPQGNPIEVYTVSVTPMNRDNITPLDVGHTMAYIVSEDDYDSVKANDIIVGHVASDMNLEIGQVSHSENWLREECVGKEASDDPNTPSEHLCVMG